MSSGEICAVIYGRPASSRFSELADAVLGQTAAVTRLVTPRGPGAPSAAPRGASLLQYVLGPGDDGLRPALDAALSHPSDWLWLLEDPTLPEPDALAGLLAGADRLDPPPVLLASKVLDPEGGLHPDGLPRHEVFEKERTVAAAGRHLVHLRAAVPGSVLVRTDALAGLGPLPAGAGGRAGTINWSARLLRDPERAGYLVPGSRAVRHAPEHGPDWTELCQRAASLTGDAWTPSEKLWESFLLGAEAVRRVRRR
jgi:hypothetical protein